MIKGPSDEEAVGAGAGGISLGAAGAPVGEGSTFVIENEALEEAGAEDEVTTLDDGVGVGSALGVGVGVDSGMLETTGGVAYADEEDAADDSIACEDDNGAEDTTVVSVGADDGDGKTVVYCVTMTTGGT